MPDRYDPAAWYWLADDGRLFSAAASAQVQATDASYVAWMGRGNAPTPWPRDATGAQTDAALQWVFDRAALPVAVDLANLKAAQTNALRQACAAAITGGFTSSALGSVHTYGSLETDQSNLDADMMAAATGGTAQGWTATIACADASGTWSAVGHTAAQVSTVWNDFRAWRIAQQAKHRALVAQVQAATTVAAVQAIA